MRILHRSCFTLGLLLGLAAAARAVTVEQIPNPRPAGWAVDLTGTLPAETLAELNRLGDDVKARTGAELAVVVVGSTDGAESHGFATRLFNTWGIGERGKDNGLLVFAALDDHNVEIVLGDGLSHGEGSAVSGLVIQEEMIPRFRAGDPAGAILAGARACVRRILDITPAGAASVSPAPLPLAVPSEPAPPASIPSEPLVSGEPPARERSLSFPKLLFGGLLGSLLLVIGLVLMVRTPRCPRCKEKMKMLEEAADDAYLEKSEQVEERIGSVDHQVWVCLACGERVKRRSFRFFSGYEKCPECSARTLRSTSTTVEEATYTHGGLVQVDQRCANCAYSNSYTSSTPMLQRPTYDDDDRRSSSAASLLSSSSSSAHSGGSSSSSSSSSGSDFGGGHSSGGGASGKW
jgi:uncharacterized protein